MLQITSHLINLVRLTKSSSIINQENSSGLPSKIVPPEWWWLNHLCPQSTRSHALQDFPREYRDNLIITIGSVKELKIRLYHKTVWTRTKATRDQNNEDLWIESEYTLCYTYKNLTKFQDYELNFTRAPLNS